MGIDDIRFAGAAGSLSYGAEDPVLLEACLPGARSLIVLFAAYRPGSAAPPGHMPLSAYYTVSHSAYHAARALTGYIQSLGAAAVHLPSLPARAAALRTGGFIGDNGFYYHPRLGSLVCIQTILTDADLPADAKEEGGCCLHCGACARSCPSGAVGRIDNCLRYHLHGLVPEPLRGDVYQLLGCEKCQTVCPLNRFEAEEPLSFPLESLLDGSVMPELKRRAGPNMARAMRVKSQAALYAANTGQRQLIPKLTELAHSGTEPIGTHAAWAVSRLTEE